MVKLISLTKCCTFSSDLIQNRWNVNGKWIKKSSKRFSCRFISFKQLIRLFRQKLASHRNAAGHFVIACPLISQIELQEKNLLNFSQIVRVTMWDINGPFECKEIWLLKMMLKLMIHEAMWVLYGQLPFEHTTFGNWHSLSKKSCTQSRWFIADSLIEIVSIKMRNFSCRHSILDGESCKVQCVSFEDYSKWKWNHQSIICWSSFHKIRIYEHFFRNVPNFNFGFVCCLEDIWPRASISRLQAWAHVTGKRSLEIERKKSLSSEWINAKKKNKKNNKEMTSETAQQMTEICVWCID